MKQINLSALCSLAGVLFCLFSVSKSSLLNDESQIAGGSTLSESITLERKSGLRKRSLLSNSFSDNVVINDNEKDQFGFYVLSMSYQPEFCYQHRRESFPGCEHPNAFWKESLTMHGLWPQNQDGSWPSSCTNEKFDPEIVTEIGANTFELLWPNVKSLPPFSSFENSDYTGFWAHEWSKHGTCSGLDQKAYFETALNHFLKTPSILSDNYGGVLSKEDLEEAYGTSAFSDNLGEMFDKENRLDIQAGERDAVLVCSGSYLSEVRICVGRSADGMGSARIPCIQEVVQEGNCGDVIHISKFYSDVDFELMDAKNSQKTEIM